MHNLSSQDVADLVKSLDVRDDRVAGYLSALSRYEGHPFCTGEALKMLVNGVDPANLPTDPGGFAETQYLGIRQLGQNPVTVMRAYAISNGYVPDFIVRKVAGLDASLFATTISMPGIDALLVRGEHKGHTTRKIYHAVLAEHILRDVECDPELTRSLHEAANSAWLSAKDELKSKYQVVE